MIELANGNRRGDVMTEADREVLFDYIDEVAKKYGRRHITNIKGREDIDDWEFEIPADDDSIIWMGTAARYRLCRQKPPKK